MITSTRPGSPTVDMSIYGVPFESRHVGGLTIELGENEHDLAILEINGLHPRAVHVYLDRPVRIDVAINALDRMTFVGYVNHVDPQSSSADGLVNSSPLQVTRVYCLGASRLMRAKRTAVWDGYTLPDLVRVVSQHYRFSFSVPDDRYRSRWVQRSESDFALLAKAAASLGYKLGLHGTHIHIWDPAKAMGRGLPFVRMHSTLTPGGVATVQSFPGRLLDFSGSFGLSGPQGDAHRKRLSFLDTDGNAFAIDNRHLDLPVTTGAPVHSPVVDDYVATAGSYTEAQRRLSTEVKDNYPFHARAVIVGVPQVLPGSIGEVVGQGGYYDGYWLIRSVKHSFARDNFITELELSRDSTNQAPARMPAVLDARPAPDPVLVDGVWKASLALEETYV